MAARMTTGFAIDCQLPPFSKESMKSVENAFGLFVDEGSRMYARVAAAVERLTAMPSFREAINAVMHKLNARQNPCPLL